MKFLYVFAGLLCSVYASPALTLYRVGNAASNESIAAGILSDGTVLALGVGKDGGTTYAQVEQLAQTTTSGTAHITVPAGTVTNTFVEQASWVYQSYADSSGKFNGYELNCTLLTDGTAGNCTKVDKTLNSTTTAISTQTFKGTATPRFVGDVPLKTTASGATRIHLTSAGMLAAALAPAGLGLMGSW